MEDFFGEKHNIVHKFSLSMNLWYEQISVNSLRIYVATQNKHERYA